MSAPRALAALLLLCGSATAQIDPRGASTTRLPCGTRVAVIRAPAPEGQEPRVDGLLLFSAGAVHESPNEAGVAAVLARALRQGGSLISRAEELEAWLGEHDANLEIGALRAELAMRFACAPGDLQEMLERLRGLIVAPAYPEPAVRAARERVLRDLQELKITRLGEVERSLEARAFSGSPWVREPDALFLGTLHRGHLLSFHRTNLGLDRLAIALHGDVELEGLEDWLDPLIAGLGRAGPAPKVETPPLKASPPGLIWLVPAIEEERAQLRIAFPVDVHGPEDAAALHLWSEIYHLAGAEGDAGGGALRLAPLALSPGERPHLWMAATECPSALAPQTLRTLLKFVSRGSVPAVSLESFEEARRSALERHARLPLDAALLAAARAALWKGSASQREEIERELAQLTPESLRVALERTLPGTGHLIVVRGPLALEPALASLELELEIPEDPLRKSPETGGNLSRPRRPVAARVVYHSAPQRPRGTPEGVELRARMIAALGGSDAWASLAALQQKGEVRVQGLETAVSANLWRDLRSQRLRLDQKGPEGLTSQVVTREHAFSFGSMRYNPLSEAQHQRVLYRERRQLARVLHDLCAEATLSVAVDAGGRLLVLEDEQPLCWIKVGPDDRPLELGYEGPGVGEGSTYTFSDWREATGARLLLPYKVEQPGEGVRFQWSEQNSLLALDETLFKRPEH